MCFLSSTKCLLGLGLGAFSLSLINSPVCFADELNCQKIVPNNNLEAVTDSSLSDYLSKRYELDSAYLNVNVPLVSRENKVAQDALSHFSLVSSHTTVHDKALGNNQKSVLINNHTVLEQENCVLTAINKEKSGVITNSKEGALVAHSNNQIGAAMSMNNQRSSAQMQSLGIGSAGAALMSSQGAGANKSLIAPFTNIRLLDAPHFNDEKMTADAYHSIDHLKGLAINASTLQNMLDSLTAYYQEKGFVLSKAYLPAQTIDEGLVDVLVANPKFNNFTIDNQSLVRDSYLEYLMSGITDLSGEDVTEDALDNQVRKLADLGTFSMFGEASNGDPNGLLKDIDFQVAPTQERFSFTVFADNYGNKSAGRYRFGGLLEVQSPTGSADRLLLSYARSDEKQNNYSFSYRLPINSHPTALGLDICYSDYELSGIYRELGAMGTSFSVDAYLIEPVIRSSQSLFNITSGVRYRKLTDEYATFDLKFKKHTWSGYLGFSGFNHLGDFLVDYKNKAFITHVYSDDDYEAVAERTYLTLEGEFGLGYRFSDEVFARSAFIYQMANKNLDGADTFLAGGETGLRAYEFGDISGDGGLIWRNEFNYYPKDVKDLCLSAHIETGKVYSHNYESESASSAGITTSYQYQGFSMEVDLSHGLGAMPYFAHDRAAIKFNTAYTF